MFKNITESYSHQDASLEILVMLLGAFLLGSLLGWFIKSYFCTKKIQYQKTQNSENQKEVTKRLKAITGKNRLETHFDEHSQQAPIRPLKSDLTKILGLTPDLENALNDNKINTFSDLVNIDKQTLTNVLNISESKIAPIELQSWPHQASLAEKGEWEKLTEYQSFMQRTLDRGSKEKSSGKTEKDDLKKIEGIGPKIEEILNDKKIFTYNDLKKYDRDTLKGILNKAGSRFDKNEPETWPLQAGMAERGEWEELKIYQEFMDNDKPLFENTDIDTDKKTTDSTKSEPETPTAPTITSVKKDDLKKIDGIGPKIQEIFNKKGIYTFKELYDSKPETLKSYLDSEGSQFMLHDPKTWPHQAGLAAKGEWRKLDEYIDYMQATRELATSKTSAAEEEVSSPPSLHIKRDTKKDTATTKITPKSKITKKALFDDLKRIEGIGPKIEQLLHKAGITSFNRLKNTNRSTIKALLDSAGPQFKMHNPDSWPHQAKMAAKGEWGELEKYQDLLFGERE